ncbi:hypothetical protein BKG76_08745 [Mycobacteroides franklinii]|uniref:Uncharacterized protein n=1 Tax=Mycobacteroides franklinii TaxID=948102 RepID=A0A1S1L508_9MYCO|nr:hypothetical protein [Mycobacteroides franklinii]OHU20837.1 hypothetical protein BKG76_08745 [Mycobacteroides franklinii]
MISPWIWQVMQIARFVFLLCFLPVLVYRIWRYPATAPAIAVTCFGVIMWFWLFTFTDTVWSLMPVQFRAASMGGLFVATVAMCAQVFILGVAASASPDRMRRGMRIILGVTAVILVVVSVSASQSQVLLATKDLHELTNALLDGGDSSAIVASVVGNGYLAVTLVQLAWVGFRHADRTPVGTGLGILAVASSFQFVAVASGGIWRPLTGGHDLVSVRYGLVLQSLTGSVGVTLLTVGFLWPPVVLRIKARRDERRLRPLHDALARVFPQLFPPEESRIRLSDLVFEWTTHIQDGLTLLAQHRQTPMHTEVELPLSKADRAAQVAKWMAGKALSGFSCEWLLAPEGLSDEEWVFEVADSFRRLGSPGVTWRDQEASPVHYTSGDVNRTLETADWGRRRQGDVGAR